MKVVSLRRAQDIGLTDAQLLHLLDFIHYQNAIRKIGVYANLGYDRILKRARSRHSSPSPPTGR